MLRLISNKTNDFMKTSFGNILEWYDFAIYGLFAIQISKTFFPNESTSIGVILAFLTFATGFISRPMGSVIFGYIGDKWGKHYSVNLSVWCMAIPTSLIGLLPSYGLIGITAPCLLVLMRVLQGISVGGQFSGLISIASENKGKQSFYTSLIYMICMVGSLFASFVGYLTVKIVGSFHSSNPFILSLVWRIPFILSGVLFFIYIKMLPDFHKHESSADGFSFIEIFNSQPKEMLYCILMAIVTGCLYYIIFTYSVTFMQLHLNISKPNALMIENLMIILAIVLFPILGKYADKQVCRLDTVKLYVYALMISSIMIMFGLFYHFLMTFSMIILLVSFVAISALTTSLFAEVFKPKYRMTACSLSFNIGYVFAGFAPLFAEASTHILLGFPILILLINLALYWIFKNLKETNGYKTYARA